MERRNEAVHGGIEGKRRSIRNEGMQLFGLLLFFLVIFLYELRIGI